MLSEKRILQEAEALLPEIVRIRRHIHQYPELSYAEHVTAEFISETLTAEGIGHIRNVAGTGIIGIIRGEAAGKGITAGLRADMDALPVSEQEGPEYRSRNEGVMHACGHDAHIAMLLGAAKLINSRRGDFAGRVLLVFQPGEEKAPGGAKLITGSGILDQYRPDLFIAQHVAPELESGTAGFCAGPAMASCDEIYITVTGRGGHAARPTECTDQIRIASELVIALKDTIETAAETKAPTVLGIGRITGCGATNVIPERVEIAGTFRTFSERWRREAKELIRGIAADLAAARGVAIDINIVEGYPVLVNDAKLTSGASALIGELLGKGRVKDIEPRMGSEDFAFFAELYPSLLYRLGVTRKGDIIRHCILHHSTLTKMPWPPVRQQWHGWH
ncbi:MAG: M20 family metallopeptidase [Bacteroidales bacterium]|nr:M20 family metallopeptidase [Bacteroidales bacterium]